MYWYSVLPALKSNLKSLHLRGGEECWEQVVQEHSVSSHIISNSDHMLSARYFERGPVKDVREKNIINSQPQLHPSSATVAVWYCTSHITFLALSFHICTTREQMQWFLNTHFLSLSAELYIKGITGSDWNRVSPKTFTWMLYWDLKLNKLHSEFIIFPENPLLDLYSQAQWIATPS